LIRGNTSNLKISRSFTKMKKDASGNFVHIASAKQQKKRFFQLTHFDSEHNSEHWKTYKKVEVNLTKIHDDPGHAIPLGPPAVTTLEPTSGDEYEDEMTFTGSWFTPSLPIDPTPVNDNVSPAAYCCPTTESEPPALIPWHDIYDSDDDNSDDDDIASDDTIPDNEPEVKSTKRVHKKKNSRANVQEVLSEAEGEGT
jgi:hypothetical protein